MTDRLPEGPALAGAWTAEDQRQLDALRRRRDEAPIGSAARAELDRALWRAPTAESSGRRYAEGL